ncbi:MAG: chemotaxis protein [Desulfobacterales bacterium]|nr:chemotaxis protein [Desulfobacterales bacterium]MDD4392492.1 chemotaxis protein [Desulfobacterales bacterium]
MKQNKILLESGTNEMELLAFSIGGQTFGVNVAKVQSIVQFDPVNVTQIPLSPPAISGMMLYRNRTIPLIDLAIALNIKKSEDIERPIVIISEFNKRIHGLRVDQVYRIYRLGWKDFIPLEAFFGQYDPFIIGSVHMADTEIMVIDLEKILATLFPDLSFEEISISSMKQDEQLARSQVQIVFVEDSHSIRNNVIRILKNSGYSDIQAFTDGQQAFESLQKLRNEFDKDNGARLPDVIVSDIEMPQMDGLTLCMKTKTELGFDQIPFIMFSSLINHQMIHKCRRVCADGYVTKPEMNKLISMIDEMCH